MIANLLRAGAFFALALTPLAAYACEPAIGGDSLVQPGKLLLSINPTNPPAQYIDQNGELQGLNVELAKALGKILCLDVNMVRMDFPGMIPALTSGRLDGMDTGMFWTAERSKILYMVPYGIQGIGILVKPGSDLKITKAEDLAGHSSSVEAASAQLKWLTDFNTANVAKGATAINIETFPTATNAVAALRAGQVDDAAITDFVARDLDKRGEAKLVLDGLGPSYMTMAFRNRPVADAIVKAFAQMRTDGTYKTLFDKFGLTPFPDDHAVKIVGPGPG